MLIKAWHAIDLALYCSVMYVLFVLATVFAIAYYLMLWLMNLLTLATGREVDPSFSYMPMEGLNGTSKGR